MGDGTTTGKNIPTKVKVDASGDEFLTGIEDIATGHEHTLALKSDGTVWAWGSNSYGQLGDGTTAQKHYSSAGYRFD